MSLGSLGPFNLTGVGQSFTVLPSGAFSNTQIGQLLLSNNSGFIIEITATGQGQLPNLNPGEVMAYDAPSNQGAMVATIIGGSATVANPQMTVQVGVNGETFVGDNPTFPGSYPFTLPLTPQTFQQLTVVSGAGPTLITPSPSAVQLVIVTAETNSQPIVTGAASGLELPFSGTLGYYVYALPGTPADQANGYFVQTPSGAPASPLYVYESSMQIIDLSLPPAGQGIVKTATTAFTFDAPPGCVGLVIQNNNGYPTVTDADGVAYPAVMQSVGQPSVGTFSTWFVPIPSVQFDGFTVTCPGSGTIVVVPVPVNPFLGTASPTWFVSLSNPALGTDWSYTLPFPMRIEAIVATLNVAAGGGGRFPVMNLGVVNCPMVSSSGLAAGSGPSQLNGFTGSPGAPFVFTGTTQYQIYPFPSLLLPRGSVIGPITGGLTGTDQWTGINITGQSA